MVEIFGMISHRRGELDGMFQAEESEFDLDYIREFAQVHEQGGFDRVLIGYGTHSPDGFGIASYIGSVTDQVGVLLAHRPGFVSPTLAARQLATLDHLLNGRLAVHIITATDKAVAGDGDFLPKDERYQRSDEYITVLKKAWTSDKPFDHHGKFYRIEGGFSSIKPIQKPYIPISFGGSSEIAKDIAARQASTWAFFGEPLAAVREQSNAIKALAASYGNEIKQHVSVRVILGATEQKAWDRAFAITERVKSRRGGIAPAATSLGTARLQQFAEQGDVLDKRLYFGISKYMGDGGNSSALVGTPEQVAESLVEYVKAGADKILMRGFDPLQDAIDYGRDLLPLVRAGVAKLEAETRPEPNKLVASVGGAA